MFRTSKNYKVLIKPNNDIIKISVKNYYYLLLENIIITSLLVGYIIYNLLHAPVVNNDLCKNTYPASNYPTSNYINKFENKKYDFEKIIFNKDGTKNLYDLTKNYYFETPNYKFNMFYSNDFNEVAHLLNQKYTRYVFVNNSKLVNIYDKDYLFMKNYGF